MDAQWEEMVNDGKVINIYIKNNKLLINKYQGKIRKIKRKSIK